MTVSARGMLCVLGVCVILESPAIATAVEEGNVWHIGLCHVGLDHEPPSLATLHETLNELGYEDGRNLRFRITIPPSILLRADEVLE